jgi:hypothetical protein
MHDNHWSVQTLATRAKSMLHLSACALHLPTHNRLAEQQQTSRKWHRIWLYTQRLDISLDAYKLVR